mmetsp:Transcript_17126/g.28367  ORF Transcript_17126/g.28367 Transcript_17126/m.28367 type:complete len:219 (-) Transcript_17126:433-1089(-)
MYQQVPDDEGGRNRAQELQENIKDPVELKIVQVGRGTRQIVASLSWTLANLKEAFFDAEVKQGKNIRIISQGKLLQDASTLEAVGLRDGAFLHVSICERNNGMVNNPADERHAASQSQFTLDHEEQIPQWLVQARFVREGNNGDFILGFIMGFFLGVLTLIWVWQRAVPRRQKLGIMLGFGFNLLLGFVQVANGNHQGQGGSGGAPVTNPNDQPGVGH